MSVEVALSKLVYPGDGIDVDFPTPYFLLQADIVASFRPLGGGLTTLALNVDYSLAGAGQPGGGTLTLSNFAYLPSPSAGTLIIRNQVPATQLRRFPRGGGTDPKNYEDAYDKLTLLVQQLQAAFSGTLRAPPDDLAGDMSLPLDTERANGFLGFDAGGLPLLYSFAQLVNLLTPAILGDVVTKTTVLSREELGLAGDGVTDDSPAYNKAVDIWSARGGATFFLQPQPGAAFFFNNPIRNKSFISTIFSGPACRLGTYAYIGIEGDFAEDFVNPPLTLLSAAVAGDNTLVIDTSAYGGGAVSSLLEAGDRISIRGSRDAASNLQEYSVHRIIAVNDGLRTITIADTLPYSYQISYSNPVYESAFGITNRTTISSIKDAVLLIDVVRGDSFVTVQSGQASIFAVDDWVTLSDTTRASDVVAGAWDDPVRSEKLKVTAIGLNGPNTITFNRCIERVYWVSADARVTLMDPALRASIDGAAAVRTTAPDAFTPTFLMSFAVESSISNCVVPNEDVYGSFGPMFHCVESADCKIIRPNARNPKDVTEGRGYGVLFEASTSCSVVDPIVSGCRFNILFQTTTQCSAVNVELDDDRLASVAWFGLGEVGDVVSLRTLTGGSQLAPGETQRRAIRFGSPMGMVGPSRCLVEGGRVAEYGGTGAACVEFMPGQNECAVRGVQFDDIDILLWHGDSTLSPTRVSDTAALEDFVVNGYAGWLVDVDGQRSGSTVRTLSKLTLSGRAYGGTRHVYLGHVDGANLRGLRIVAAGVDVTEPYAVMAIDVLSLAASRCEFSGCGRGFALTNCTGSVRRTDFESQSSTVVLQDNGSNSIKWRYNDAVDFTWSKEVTGTPSAGLVEYPLAISATSDFVRLP